MKMSELVSTYIAIRDRRAVRKAAFTAEDAKDKALAEKIEAVFLKLFTDQGTDSVKTSAGTAYRTTRTSATVADKTVFLEYIMANAAFELLDVRANKTAVNDFKEVNDTLPPGVNWSAEHTVNVRR